MNKLEIFGYASLLCNVLIVAIYLPSILRGKTKPHIFTYLIYAALTGILFWIQVTAGGGPGTWNTGATAFLCIVTALLCIKYGTRDITRSDKISFGIGIVAIAAWCILKDPLVTLCLLMLAEMMGFYPTIRKSYRNPYEEPMIAYVISFIKLSLAIAATENLNFYTLSYPVFFNVIYVLFVVMLLYRRKIVPAPSVKDPVLGPL